MDIYLFFVFVLFALAITDLVVGVSNDAVNFLNSAIGSKVAPRHIIMIVASLGIIAGALFSNGMMEVARKGIFHPEHYYFTEIMVVFMAVMLTDILLLNFFNTIGLPTSTTVSIVFELLGAAIAVAVVKAHTQADALPISDYINSSKALVIIAGILLSVVVAFSIGALVQWVSRIIFTFNYERPIKYFGAIWGGLAISAITYFILIKGAKSASFMTSDIKLFIKDNTLMILFLSFGFWTILMQIFYWLFKINILKVVVLTGTFALAMAFSGNDLVNFIGVPLAGFEAFNLFQSNGGQDLLMVGLSAKVHTPTIFLLIAGLVMVVTIWFSKKARSVTETELNLARQDEGFERWSSSTFARLLVGRAVGSTTFFSKVLPESFINGMRKRFDQTEYNKKIQKQKNPPMFDLIRASVNLTVASILISFATSLKLPLSTTYVTFMVAMGTSLADRAWGRDSAVYRITGVFTVIGGWFMTALVAFTVAFVIALFISWAKLVAVVILILVAIYMLVSSTKKHKKKEKSKIVDEELISTADEVMAKCRTNLSGVLVDVLDIFSKSIEALRKEDRKELRKQWQLTLEFNKRVKKQKDKIHIIISELQQDSIETGHFYTQVVNYQRELIHDLSFMLEPILNHVENHHKAILPIQSEELIKLVSGISIYFNKLQSIVFEKTFDQLDSAIEIQNLLISDIEESVKSQIKRIKNNEVGTRNSMLYMNIMSEIKNMLLNTLNMVKAQRDFVINDNKV